MYVDNRTDQFVMSMSKYLRTQIYNNKYEYKQTKHLYIKLGKGGGLGLTELQFTYTGIRVSLI